MACRRHSCCSCWTGGELLVMVLIFFVGGPALVLGIKFFSWLGWSPPVAGGVVFLAGAFVAWAWHGFPLPSLREWLDEED